MKLTKWIATFCSWSLVLACGGRTAFQATGANPGSGGIGNRTGDRETGGSAGPQEIVGHAGVLNAGGSTGSAQAEGGTGAQQAGGGEQAAGGSAQPAGSNQNLWLAHGSFDESSFDVAGSIKDFAVDPAGNVYLASDSPPVDAQRSFTLARLRADGQVSWRQQVSGEPMFMTVDEAGTIYQLRVLNQVGVLDKRTAEGKWLWSREINETSLGQSVFRRGKDGALYLGTRQGERLWKFDLDGNVGFRWQGPGQRAVASVAADAKGTVYLRTWVKPTAMLPGPAKGQDAPMDGLFWTLDPSSKELSQRLFATESVGDSSLYIENGPVNFALTAGGQLLSAAATSVGLFDTAGNALWKRNVSDLKPALDERRSYYWNGVLSAGRCGYCIASSSALLAFDATGNQTEVLLLDYKNEFGSRWATDQKDNIYVLIGEAGGGGSSSSRVRRYHAGSGWTRP